MNDAEAKTLGMNALAAGLSWQPRMMNGLTGLSFIGEDHGAEAFVLWADSDGCLSPFPLDHEDWPDFRDPPTMGWLVHQVREAWGDPDLCAIRSDCDWCVYAMCLYCESSAETMARHEGPFGVYSGKTEVEALLLALEHAPKGKR